MRQAAPLSFSGDGSMLLVVSNVPGTQQLYVVPARGGELRQLTEFDEPVVGQFLPDGRILLEMDDGGNERTQLYLLDAEPGAVPEPLVVDPRFNHKSPVARPRRHAARVLDEPPQQRRLRRRRAHAAGAGRSGATSRAAGAGAAGISPDGRWIVVSRLGDRAGDNDLFLFEPATGDVVHATPHDDEAEFLDPVWLADSSGFFAATNDARDTFAICALRPRVARVGDGRRVALGSRVLRRRGGAEPARRRERGRLLDAGAARSGDGRAARAGAAAGPRRRRASGVLGRRLAARVRPLAADRAARRVRLRPRRARADAADDEPARRRSRDARRAGAAPVRELRRRVDSRVPLRAGRRRAVPGRRHGARRPGVAVAAVVLAELRAADAVPRLARLRGRGAERARLDGVRQALRASRRRAAATRLGARSRVAARVARRASGDRRVARGALRPLVRRLHGARRPRVPARSCGPPASRRSASRASSRSSRTRRTTAEPPASASTARSRTTATSCWRRRRSRTSTRSARRSSSSTAATTRASRSASRSTSTAS